MISRIAVLFPGIGYTKNHPLLYHSGKLAQQYGYKVKALEFSGFPHKLKGNREALMTSFQIAVGQAEDQRERDQQHRNRDKQHPSVLDSSPSSRHFCSPALSFRVSGFFRSFPISLNSACSKISR